VINVKPVAIKILIPLLSIALLTLIFFEVVHGIPFCRMIAIQRAKKYVRETYQLTVIKTDYCCTFFPMTETVTVTTEELNFKFSVNAGIRVKLPDGIYDDYLESMSAYILSKDINDYVREKTNDQSEAHTFLYSGRINKYTLSELEENPQIAFEKLNSDGYADYYCSITIYEDIREKNYDIDYDLIYDIYNKIFEIGLNPHGISFFYNDKKEKNDETLLYLNIKKEYFSNINSPDDLKPFFEEAISKK